MTNDEILHKRTGQTVVTRCECCREEREMEHVIFRRTLPGAKWVKIDCYECLTCGCRHDKALTDIFLAELG